MKRDALAWLARLRASGGTEMHTAIVEALRPLRAESQRQVVLVTDGLIGFETEVVRAIALGLPAGSRVHTVGVGSAVNRSLTGPAARAGHGVEVVIGLGEDPERAARRLVARTDAPLVVDLELTGSALIAHAPRALPDLFAGRSRARLRRATPRGRHAHRPRPHRERRLRADDRGARAGGRGRAEPALRPRARGGPRAARGDGEGGLDAEIERVGLAFQIATRLTSWVAVSEEPAVDPGAPTKRVRMPQELPHGCRWRGSGCVGRW
jgi:Ca-activated chloride channel family protein